MSAKQTERAMWEVLKYIEMWHKVEPTTASPTTPMNRKERGKSKAPVSDRAADLMIANRHAGRVISPLLEELKNTKARHQNILFSDLLISVRYDPGIVRRWRSEDGIHWRALLMLCRLVAQAAVCKIPGMIEAGQLPEDYELRVWSDPRDEEAATRREAADRERSLTAHDSYRRIVPAHDRLLAEGYSVAAADAELSERLDCSVAKIRRARAFVKGEREDREDGAA